MIAALFISLALAQPANKPAKHEAKPDAPPADKATPKGEAPLVAFPHPLITEVYYAVATGPGGDANGDGSRDANGDEFIELINPHDRPINLKGYTLSDKGPHAITPGETHDREQDKGKTTGKTSDKSKTADKSKPKPDYHQMMFTFPECELAPGQVVVIFNGHEQKWEGPVGDKNRAPQKGHEKFHGALVFTMGISMDKVGLANKGDYVLLTAPDRTPVECVKWGDVKEPAEHGLLDEVPLVNGQSVQRRSPTGAFEAHPEVNGSKFSPGAAPGAMESAKTGESKTSENKPSPNKSSEKPKGK